MNNYSTVIMGYPSFRKGMARAFDLFGSLDQYRYSKDADAESIQKDWEMIGQDLFKAIKNGTNFSNC